MPGRLHRPSGDHSAHRGGGSPGPAPGAHLSGLRHCLHPQENQGEKNCAVRASGWGLLVRGSLLHYPFFFFFFFRCGFENTGEVACVSLSLSLFVSDV